MRTIAIVGRPNVGKSALFNRLARKRISIVHDMPGVTRDRITAECTLGQHPFTIIDTGGIGSDADATFAEVVETEVQIAIETSDAILFVVDGHDGLTPVDQTIAQRLRKISKPVILVVNKIDHPNHAPFDADFARLGFREMINVSAEHGHGIAQLVEMAEAHLPPPSPEGDDDENAPPIQIAIVGRPNVGKSSLVNAILEDNRTLVSPISGTTRDAIDIPYRRGNRSYTLIDTAGIRPRGKQENSVEVFSVIRSEKTIRRADLCVLVIDASMGVTAQDKKIAGLIQEAHKPCIIAVNKWDLIKEAKGFGTRKEQLAETLEAVRAELFFVDYAPIILLSALKSEGLSRLFRQIETVRQGAKKRISTGPLNRLIGEAMEHHPPPLKGGKRLKIMYATQPDRHDDNDALPTPSILFFVNRADLMVDAYRKYLENTIRKEMPWPGLPLRFLYRERGKRQAVEAE